MKKVIYLFLFLLVYSFSLRAQTGIVVGINGQYLVRVNLETGELIPLHHIQNLPRGVELRNLVYISREKALYTTMNSKSQPVLIRLLMDGSWTEVGRFSYDANQFPYFCEGLTYDERTDQLLVAASLDGSIANNDYQSESLLEVDRTNASCRLIATIRQGLAPDDFDEIAFFGGQLFCLDGVPGTNTTYVFPFATQALHGELFSGTKQNIPYFTMDDVMTMGQLLYFPNARDQSLYYYDLMARKWKMVAQLNGPASIGTIKLTGLAFVPLAQA